MTTFAEATDIALDVFQKANSVVKEKTGESIVAHALDVALPVITKALPAISFLTPLIRNIALPAIESSLTANEYAEVMLSLQAIDEAAADIASAATIARARIATMSDEEVDQWLKDNDLYRKDE